MTWLDDIEGSRIEADEAVTWSFDQGAAWANMELARGQVMALSFNGLADVFLYGPVTHRHTSLVRPGVFFEPPESLFVEGWARPEQIIVNPTRGGHYLLVALPHDSTQTDVTISSRCVRGCTTRQELEARLFETLPDTRAFELPARQDLTAIPYDPKNPLNAAKIELGRRLFHAPELATQAKKPTGVGTYSCASCHNLNHGSGAGAPQGIGEGGTGGVFNMTGWSERLIDTHYAADEIDAQPIASPTIINSAYLGAGLWNGALGLGDVVVPGGEPVLNPNKDYTEQWKVGTPPYWSHLGFSGLETQALVGLHVHRQSIFGSTLEQNSEITELFEQAFSQQEIDTLREVEDCYHALRSVTFPETYFSAEQASNNDMPEAIDCDAELPPAPYRDSAISDLKVSLALAAYERSLLATNAPFQVWLRKRGAQESSHAMTLDEMKGALVFFGKEEGNCVSCHTGPALSDQKFHVMGLSDLLASDRSRVHTRFFEGEENGRGGWTSNDSLKYAFKTPQLYNLSQKSFYGHGSTHRTLESMIRYMVRGERMVGFIGGDRALAEHFTKRPLSESQILDLITFVESGLMDETLLDEMPEVVAGTCLISADTTSREEQGCRKP